MFGMGMGELIVIAIVALLFLGPDKIPEAAKAVGKAMRELRKQTKVVQETLEGDHELGNTVREIKSALRGDEPRPVIRPPAASGVGRAPIGAPASPVLPAEPPTVEPAVASTAPATAPATADAPAPLSENAKPE